MLLLVLITANCPVPVPSRQGTTEIIGGFAQTSQVATLPASRDSTHVTWHTSHKCRAPSSETQHSRSSPDATRHRRKSLKSVGGDCINQRWEMGSPEYPLGQPFGDLKASRPARPQPLCVFHIRCRRKSTKQREPQPECVGPLSGTDRQHHINRSQNQSLPFACAYYYSTEGKPEDQRQNITD